MFVSKIQFERYKSIIDPVMIHFRPGYPTVLIGKNGSGKTNVLEALEAISSESFTRYSQWGEKSFPFVATINVSKEDIETLAPKNETHDEQIVAYNDEDGMRVTCIRSDTLVPLLKKEVESVRSIGEKLKKVLACYEKQLQLISHSEFEELPIHCFSVCFGGRTTNYNSLKNQVQWKLDNLKKISDELLKSFSNDYRELRLQSNDLSYLLDAFSFVFQLEYNPPDLAPFEQAYISIDEKAIKRRINRINKATRDACEQINQCVQEIKEREKRLVHGFDISPFTRIQEDECAEFFLRNIQQAVGKKCSFLRNENRDLIFKSEKRDVFYYQTDKTATIIETFIKSFCQGEERERLLSDLKSNQTPVLSPNTLSLFEEKLNQSLPAFEEGMFNSVSVEQDERGQMMIYLHEKSGEKIALNETSSGRRWYFTYFFIKNTLEEGDLFLIDEPAGMLHPTAQKEILKDLMDLAKKGIQVVYSTHSPYLIPSEWNCVQFVSMGENGTQLSKALQGNELNETIHEVVGKDVFFLQEIFEKYNKDNSEVIARKCYEAIKKKWATKTAETASEILHVSQETIKSWQKGIKRPELSNVLLVASLTDENILDLV